MYVCGGHEVGGWVEKGVVCACGRLGIKHTHNATKNNCKEEGKLGLYVCNGELVSM